MKPRFWLILSVAILFGIEAPLCVLACTSVGAQETSVVADQSGSMEMPCHGPASDSVPEQDNAAHQDCGCGFDLEGVAGSWNIASIDTTSVAAIFQNPFEENLADRVLGNRRLNTNRGIRPPDILLQKSTLLI